ncbi:MAG: PAS domain S-box protein [Planctomycetes bacterium]|nr:PAS domain S-box protein [Planctomycetota bacterium]
MNRRENDENFRALAESASDGIVICSGPDGRHVYANPRMAEITGYSVAELMKMNIRGLAEPSDLQRIMDGYHRRMEGDDTPGRYEAHLRRKDGTRVSVEVAATRTVWRGAAAAMGIFRDITARKRTKKMAREQGALMRTLIENIPVDFWARDVDMRCIMQSKISRQRWGDLKEKPFDAQYLNPRTIAVWEENNRRVLSGETIRGEAEVTDVHGKKYHCYNILAPITDQGRITGILGVNVDITERKQMEEALRTSEAKYRLLYDSALVGLFTTAIGDGRILEVNDHGVRMLGYESREEFLREFVAGDHYADPYSRDRFLSKLEEKGEVHNHEAEFTRKDGSRLWLAFSAKAYPDKGWIEVAAVDIDERRRMEQELRKFKTISDNANDGMAMAELDGTLIYVNEYFAQVHGYRPEEVVGRNLSVFHTDEQMKDVAAINEKLQKSGSYSAEEVWHKRRDGSVFPMLMNGVVIRDDHGHPSFMAATAIDITELKEAENALRESEEKYRALIEGTNYPIINHALDGRILFINAEGARHLGGKPRDFLGRKLDDIFPPDVAHHQMASIKRVAESGKRFMDRIQSIVGGRLNYYEANLEPLKDEEGKVTSVLVTVTNVTERETARKQAKNLSQRIITLQEELLADISRELHDEIGQLLTAIDFEVEAIRRAMASGKDLPPDGLDRIKEVTRSAVGMVRDLCSNLRAPVIADVGLTAVMRTHIDDFRERTGIDVEFKCSLDRSGMSPDAGLGVFRIMQEALTNVARHANATRVELSLYPNNGRTVLKILDNGRGFDPDEKPPRFSGGLRGMQERTRIFGGEFVIESRPGGGTCIRVSPPPPSGEEAPL